MQEKTVTHEQPGGSLTVTVSEADVLTGMQHTMLINEARAMLQAEKKQEEPDEQDAGKPEEKSDKDKKDDDLPLGGAKLALFLIRRYTWPNCKAPTISSKGFDHTTLTFDEFCKLPEAFVAQWEAAALDLNSHWKLQVEDEKDEEEQEEEKKGSGASKKK